MGQKVHPTGIRLGISTDWNSKWYANAKEFPIGNSLALAYHFEFQSVEMPNRIPVGCTFCPISKPLSHQKQ